MKVIELNDQICCSNFLINMALGRLFNILLHNKAVNVLKGIKN